MRRIAIPVLACLALLTLLPAATAQAPFLYDFKVSLQESQIDIPFNGVSGNGVIVGTIEDHSKVPPSSSPVPVHALPHRVTITTQMLDAPKGWTVNPVDAPANVASGATATFRVPVIVSGLADSAYMQFAINVTIHTEDGSDQHFDFLARVHAEGLPTFSVVATGFAQLDPHGITNFHYTLRNLAFNQREFKVAVPENPCHMVVAYDDRIVADGKQSRSAGVSVFDITVQANEGIFFLPQQCRVGLQVTAADDPAEARTFTYTVQVSGFGPPPSFYFWALFLLLLLLLLILLFRRSRRQYESRILGKPDKPWLIPVEAVYLKALKQKDPQAWHVVRHHLMEDEYRSSLLWFEAYKKATKGSRKKQRVVLKHEDRYTKWKAKWQKAIAKPLRQADRFEAKLQRKLDRKAKKVLRKETKAWRQSGKKASAKADKLYAKALKKHVKLSAKARKKGLPEPAAPLPPQRDAGQAPELRPILLADHRWSKKAARFRRRRVREQGNLEVKFEKQDARYLGRVRRKVQKIARKMDDPEFVHEHPMLSDH